MDVGEVDRWFSEYLEDFTAVARKEREPHRLLSRYGLPLTITLDDGVVQMSTAEDVIAVVGRQLDQLRAQGFAGSHERDSLTTLFNHTSALRTETLVRRRGDGSELDQVTMSYLIIESGDGGPRITFMAVHERRQAQDRHPR